MQLPASKKYKFVCYFLIGWALVELLYVDININKYNPLRASSWIPLPMEIQHKKAVVNVQNDDEYCFGWAVTSGIAMPVGPSNRTSSYPDFRQLLQFDGIEFPVRLRDISKFENINPQLSINVYGVEEVFKDNKTTYEIVGPLYYTSNKRNVHLNLLMITNEVGNSHYCWISNFSRLVSRQITARDGAKHFCDGCLHYFRKEEQLLHHMRFDCNHIYTKLPTTALVLDKLGKSVPENVLKFDNYQRQLKVPFVVYADFETMLKPIATVEPNPKESFTITTYEHIPHSFAYYIKCSYDDSLSKFESYRSTNDNNVAVEFIMRLERDIRNLYENHLKKIVPLTPLTPSEIENFQNAVVCHICNQPFNDEDVKVRDHCHLGGGYRGAAHSICNLNFTLPNFIPIFFHNLTGYDSHLFVKQLALDDEEIDVIPLNKEKYVSFSKKILVDDITTDDGDSQKVYLKLRFLDSFRFMACSLQKLAANLPSDQCIEIKKYFGDGEKFKFMRQKGVFPYSYIDSISKLNQVSLPTREEFYDALNEEHISELDHKRAVDVWRVFGCTTLGDYSDIYLKSDVLLLADVFENFRNICLEQYKLDPAQYYTSPGLTWDAMLKHTSIELELLVDMDMLHFIRKGIRGGVSTCVCRKAIANNSYLPNYDCSQPSSFIMYLDATNLYGYAMKQSLPERDFIWLSNVEIENFDVLGVSDDSEVGYVLEVDLQYPESLHDEHNDLPFCPESMVPPDGKFKVPKLIPNLFDKRNYIIHYRNLKQCLEAGLVLTKIHKILKFQQSPWLKGYIELNTQLRNESKNAFEKDFYKGMINSMFGKTMENVDKRVDVKLLSHWEKIGNRIGVENLVAKPNFKDLAVFGDNLVAVEMNRTSVVYNKPAYIGFSILDISKTVMYDFYYNYLKKQYGNNVNLLYTDTDSLVIQIVTNNFYEDMKQNLDKFDTSNYKTTNLQSMPRNQSVVGKMKDEFAGVPVLNFYGAGAKSYCVNVHRENGGEIKKAKGVKKSVIDKMLTTAKYQNVVDNNQVIHCKMQVFKSRLHNMYTELRNKIALTPYDDKRYLIPNTPKTLAWGHVQIENDERGRNLDNLLELMQAELVEDQ